MGSTSVYHEGLRIGPTRVVKSYEPLEEWFDLIRRNVRMADAMLGDFNAQIAAIRTGERRFAQLLDRIGVDVFEDAKENIFRQSAELDRQAITEIPDGRYRAEGFMDDDGTGFGPIKVCASVTVVGDRMIVDLAGNIGAGAWLDELRRRADGFDDPAGLQDDDQSWLRHHGWLVSDLGCANP